MSYPIFEAYLTLKENKYFLYIDEFYTSEIFNSIGKENIKIIRILHEGEFGEVIDDEAYNGVGEIPLFWDIVKIAFSFDYIIKIVINENIEIKFYWWDDLSVEADLDVILKIIEGHKKYFSEKEVSVLDQIIEDKSTYYFLDGDSKMHHKKMDCEEFINFIDNSYSNKMKKLVPTLIISEQDKIDLIATAEIFDDPDLYFEF